MWPSSPRADRFHFDHSTQGKQTWLWRFIHSPTEGTTDSIDMQVIWSSEQLPGSSSVLESSECSIELGTCTGYIEPGVGA